MGNKINIAELLKGCPRGMKLYSELFGEVSLEMIENDIKPIVVKTAKGIQETFYPDGLYLDYDGAECLLWPSKIMRTWQNFKKPQEEPKFQVGDVVRRSDGTMGVVIDNAHEYVLTTAGKLEWEETYVVANDTEIDQWNEQLHKLHRHYSRSKRKIVHWMLPFDRVLVRDFDEDQWQIELFQAYTVHGSCYVCLANSFYQCIPYEGNEHLLDTTDKPKEE